MKKTSKEDKEIWSKSYGLTYYEMNKEKIKSEHADYRKRNKDKVLAQQYNWVARNKDKVKGYQNKYAKKMGKALMTEKSWKFKGIPCILKEYNSLLKSQGGTCAICGTSPAERRLSVDHDHITGEIRGLLCTRCNTALGLLEDNCALFESAIQYLKKYGQKSSQGI